MKKTKNENRNIEEIAIVSDRHEIAFFHDVHDITIKTMCELCNGVYLVDLSVFFYFFARSLSLSAHF